MATKKKPTQATTTQPTPEKPEFLLGEQASADIQMLAGKLAEAVARAAKVLGTSATHGDAREVRHATFSALVGVSARYERIDAEVEVRLDYSNLYRTQRPSAALEVHAGVNWCSIGTVPPAQAMAYAALMGELAIKAQAQQELLGAEVATVGRMLDGMLRTYQQANPCATQEDVDALRYDWIMQALKELAQAARPA